MEETRETHKLTAAEVGGNQESVASWKHLQKKAAITRANAAEGQVRGRLGNGLWTRKENLVKSSFAE